MDTQGIVTIPKLLDQYIAVNFIKFTRDEEVCWYQITPESFIKKVLPEWKRITTEVPKQLVVIPFYFILQISAEKIIYFSMFDEQGLFFSENLSHIRISNFKSSSNASQDDLQVETSELFDPHSPQSLHSFWSSFPEKIASPEFASIPEIISVTLFDENSHVIQSTGKELSTISEAVLEVTPLALLEWSTYVYLETSTISINGPYAYLAIDTRIPNWAWVKKGFKGQDEVDYTLCIDLRKYSGSTIRLFLWELLTTDRVEFEFESQDISPQEFKEALDI